MSRTPSRGRPSRVCSDEINSSRLRALGYSLARPPVPVGPTSSRPTCVSTSDDDEPQQGAVKSTLQHFVDQVEATIASWQRGTGRGGAPESETQEASSPISYASDEESSSSSFSPEPASSSSGTPRLHDLLRFVDEHKAAALASKDQKERKKRKGKEPPPVTPRQAAAQTLEDLQLDSAHAAAGPSSPQKRRRRSSTPTTPCPPDVLTTPTRSRRPVPALPASVASSGGSPSPRKPPTGRLPHVLTLLSLSLRLAGATDSPLVATATRFASLVPGVTFAEAVDFAQALRGEAPLLTLAHERAKASGRTFEPSLNFVGDHIFSASPKKLPDPQRATLFLAKELNLYPPPPPKLAAPTASSSLRILSTSRTTCVQCGSSLILHRRPSTPVYLVEPASPASLVLVASHTCSNSSCRALHSPDHVEISHGGVKVWLWEAQLEAIKVGDRVWLSQGFARHYRTQLLEQATSAGAAAAIWTKLYSEETPPLEGDDRADSSDEEDGADGASGKAGGHVDGAPGSFVLRQRHVWRALVVYACVLAASSSSHGRFASLARPLTEHLVALANTDLFSPSSPCAGAAVLPEHSCAVCSKTPHRWRGGPATDDERAEGVRWAGTHAREGKAVAPDTKPVEGPDVQFAVCDGIEIGHPLCAAPACPNPPEAQRRTRRFCSSHVELHLVCGIVDCERERVDAEGGAELPSEACDSTAHQALWRAFVERRRRLEERGWTGRRATQARKYALSGIDERKDLEDDLQLYSEDDEEELEVGEREERKPSLGKEAASHTWNLRRTSNLQILVAACGAPLAWTKFAEGETASEVTRFLSSAHKQLDASFPTYIAYDRACHVLRDVLSSGNSLPPLLSSSRLVVTAFHKRIHPAADAFCEEYCTPTPLDGGAPDLVVPYRPVNARGKFLKRTPRTFERAFNTSAAEQLNSTIARFAPLLATFRADNFDFLVALLLLYRREEVDRKAS